MQTALIITLQDGSQALVTLEGVHVPEEVVHVAQRPNSWDTWSPPLPVEVRHEGQCDTCSGSGRWETTLEDSPAVLVDIGPCPDC